MRLNCCILLIFDLVFQFNLFETFINIELVFILVTWVYFLKLLIYFIVLFIIKWQLLGWKLFCFLLNLWNLWIFIVVRIHCIFYVCLDSSDLIPWRDNNGCVCTLVSAYRILIETVHNDLLLQSFLLLNLWPQLFFYLFQSFYLSPIQFSLFMI